jgi:hypothetical protein
MTITVCHVAVVHNEWVRRAAPIYAGVVGVLMQAVLAKVWLVSPRQRAQAKVNSTDRGVHGECYWQEVRGYKAVWIWKNLLRCFIHRHHSAAMMQLRVSGVFLFAAVSVVAVCD